MYGLRQPPAVHHARVPGEEVSKRVLIVEDEQDVADLVADVLDLEGFEAQVARSGETALDDALTFHPDVVLLDLMMPGVDGFEVARRLQAHPETNSLPIVVMTAMHDAPSRAQEVGTYLFLAKPFDIGDLIQTVERAMI
jgi:DNA-binding response OmpR family regulator